MKARTVAILAVGVFLLGGACGALYAVLNSNTPSNNDKLPVGSYSDLQNQDGNGDEKDNKDNQDNNVVNNDSQDNSQENNNATGDNEENNSTDANLDNNSTKTGEVTVREDSALTLRKGPGTEYERLGQIYRGDSVEILDEQTGWYKVKTYDGVEAWVSAEYIEITQ